MPLIGPDAEVDVDAALPLARASLDAFPGKFEAAFFGGLRRKLGPMEAREDDLALGRDLLGRMAENTADFTLTFRRLGDAAAGAPDDDGPVRALFADPAAFDDWRSPGAAGWRGRVDPGRSAGTPCGRSAPPSSPQPSVQAALAAAQSESDFGPLDALLTVLARPHDDRPGFADYADPPRPEEVVRETFCGT